VALASGLPLVIDADALVLLQPGLAGVNGLATNACVLTPHEGEMQVLERNFGLSGQGDRPARAVALARAAQAMSCSKGLTA
jgi:NAD(P)H-hydrate repair Nnr-like enzyme with NAD(P)H-hydrate dehydratase domain